MTTAAPSTALATIQPAFTDAERLALAGFLAGYGGLTGEAYALDLRQFTTWCRARSLTLFAVRRADIEDFARDLEARGREPPFWTPTASWSGRAASAQNWVFWIDGFRPAQFLMYRQNGWPAGSRQSRTSS
jgi:hypothetical protein